MINFFSWFWQKSESNLIIFFQLDSTVLMNWSLINSFKCLFESMWRVICSSVDHSWNYVKWCEIFTLWIASSSFRYIYNEFNRIFIYFTYKKSTRIRNAPAKLQAATIHVYDVAKVLGVSKKLAEKYIIDSDNLIGMHIIERIFYFRKSW